MVTVILCVFLLSYMYGEGKSNYFKGSILILSYLVVMVGFYFAGFDNGHPTSGGKYDGATAVTSYRTVGRSRSGVAFAPPS